MTNFLAYLEMNVMTACYRAKIRKLEARFSHMKRLDYYKQPTHFQDAYCKNVALFLVDCKNEQVRVLNQGRYLSLSGAHILCVPKYSYFDFVIEKGSLEFDTYFFDGAIPMGFPNQLSLYRWDGVSQPQTCEGAMALIESSQKLCDVRSVYRQNHLAEVAKDYLDQNFAESSQINELAKDLGVSRTALHKNFTESFGLSPVEYRHRLRVFEAIRLLRLGHSVTYACFESGFSHHGQFVEHFKRAFKARPSQYSYPFAGDLAQLS